MSKEVKKVQVYNLFRCDACKDAEDMGLAKFKEHLLSVHGIDANNFKGTKQMTMHIDGADWYTSTFKWTLESGFIFHQFTQNRRRKGDSYHVR